MIDKDKINDLESPPSSPESESTTSRFRPKWSEIDCANSGKRWMHASILFNNKYILTFGGGNGRESLDDLIALDLETNTWKTVEILGQKPVGRYGHAGDIFGNDTFVIYGGQGGGTNILKETLMMKFDSSAMDSVICVINNGANFRDIARTRHSASIHKNNLYVFGGKDDKKASTKTLLRMDLTNFEWTLCTTRGFQPEARHGHSSLVSQDKMYVFGGYSPQPVAGMYLNEILIFDLNTSVWEKAEPKGTLPIARDATCIKEHDGNIYVFGGRGKDGSFNDLFAYDKIENTWTQIQARNIGPSPRISYTSIVYKNDLIIWGGGVPSGCFSNIYRLKLRADNDMNMGRLERMKTISNHDAKIMKLYAFNKQFSDVTFVVEGQKFYCHKVILSSQCKYFENMFTSDMLESHSKEILITDISIRTFTALIKYIYGQDVELDEDLGKDLFRLADKWNITGLRDRCEKYLMHIISLDNFKEIAQLAEDLGTPKLMDVTMEFALRHLKDLEKSSTLYSLPNSVLVKALFKAVESKESHK